LVMRDADCDETEIDIRLVRFKGYDVDSLAAFCRRPTGVRLSLQRGALAIQVPRRPLRTVSG
jgi:hypothetical protein